jgi:hypothetical protein
MPSGILCPGGKMARQITCTKCHGKGHEVIARGSGLDYDYQNACTGCGGTGYTLEYQPSLPQIRTGQKSGAAGKESVPKSVPPGSTLKTLFGIGGLFVGAVIGNHLFSENGIAILVTAVICAVIASAIYKWIIGLIIAVVVLAAIFDSEKKTPKKSAIPRTTSEVTHNSSASPVSIGAFTRYSSFPQVI